MASIEMTASAHSSEALNEPGIPARHAFAWLRAGWRDLAVRPVPSLMYGTLVFLVSLGIVSGLVTVGWDYALFPALAGFMIVAPVLAVGLYEKSRLLSAGHRATLRRMVFATPASGGQLLFTGVLLCLLMLLWMRAAVIIYALFFGLHPFPGLDGVTGIIFTTPAGWGMLLVGTVVGGLFAAFSFAIGVFSIPMLLDRKTDAFTAMATSMARVWRNLPVMLTWGAIVAALSGASLVTGLIGLVVVFPLLGHATWHAYSEVVRGGASAGDPAS